MNSCQIFLSGTFEVRIDGQHLVNFATDKARALLAYLVVEHDRPHRREALAALLWADQSEERARQNLRQALLHLRQSLAGCDDLLLVNAQTVQLNPTVKVFSDVRKIMELADQSNQHHHRAIAQCLPCMRIQQEIRALYRGEFMAGFSSGGSEPFEEWMLVTRENVHNHVLQALIRLADYYEFRGEIREALACAREQVKLEPWREEAHRQVMRLLAADGQYSAALAQFKICRQVMLDEFGIEPTRETTGLIESIRSHAPVLPQKAVEPGEFSSSFVGRKKELDDLAQLIARPECRLISIIGPGGAGKTRLAQQCLQEHNGLFRDGMYRVSLSSARSMADALLMIAETLHLAVLQGADVLPQLQAALAQKQALILLDDFEHLAEECESVSQLLSNSPGLQFLVTSRSRLQLREEWVYILDGFDIPPDDTHLAEIDQYDALVFFADRSRQILPSFVYTSQNLPTILTLCRLLQGSPLGLELAAAACVDQSLEQLTANLQQSMDHLLPALRNLPQRHRSLRIVFDHSWALLHEHEQQLLLKCSVFSSSFSVEAAAAIAGITTEELHQFVMKSFLRQQSGDRFVFHGIVYEFIQEKLALEEQLTAQLREYHAGYFASLAQKISTDLFKSAEVMSCARNEYDNLLAAWQWCLRQADHSDRIEALLTSLSALYYIRGPMAEGVALFKHAMQVLEPGTHPDVFSQLKLEIARLLSGMFNFEESQIYIDQLLGAYYDEEQATSVYAQALFLKGQLLSMQGESMDASAYLLRAQELARSLGLKKLEADCLKNLGNSHTRVGHHVKALEAYREGLQLYRELGDQGGESSTLNNLGTVHWDRGEYDQARSTLEQALAIYQQMGDLRGEAKALNNLGNVAADQGELTESLRYLQRGLEINRRIGNTRGQSTLLMNIGATYQLLKLNQLARRSYNEALHLFREINNRQAQGEVLGNLGLLAGCEGRYDDAVNLLSQAIELSREVDDPVNLANAHFYLGRVEKDQGHQELAEKYLQEALSYREEVLHPARVDEILVELAHLAWCKGNRSAAMEMLEPVVNRITLDEFTEGMEEPQRTCWFVFVILADSSHCEVDRALMLAQQALMRAANQIDDPESRQRFLQDDPVHRQIYALTQ